MELTKGIYRIIELYQVLQLNRINFGVEELAQSFFRKSDLLLVMLLFPLYSISTVNKCIKHPISKYIKASKNTFYRLKNNDGIDWRRIVKNCNKKLLKQLQDISEASVKCLIIDDTDFKKTTYKTEHISKI